VPLVEQELSTLPENMISIPVLDSVRVTQSLIFCVLFCRSLFVLWSDLLVAAVLSVLLRFTFSDYSFGISKPLAIVLSVSISVF